MKRMASIYSDNTTAAGLAVNSPVQGGYLGSGVTPSWLPLHQDELYRPAIVGCSMAGLFYPNG